MNFEQPEIAHIFSDRECAKETKVPAGQMIVQHKHKYSHIAVLASGFVELTVDGKREVLRGPIGLVIEAGKYHGVRALTDVVWYCIHAVDPEDRDHVDEVVIAPDSDPEEGMRVIAAAAAGGQ